MRHSPIRSILLLAFLGVLPAALLAEEAPAPGPDPAGRWQGAIETPAGELAVTVVLATTAEGAWVGTIDIPAQGVRGYPLAAVAVDGTAVGFAIPNIPGAPTFDGTLDAAGEAIAGDFRQAGQTMPFALTRAAGEEEAPAAEVAPDPVPGEGLVGEWAGTLSVGVLKLRLALHVEETEGGLAAVLDSLDQGAKIPIDDIALEDGTVRFTIAAIGATYEGAMNDDGSAVVGTWTQNARSAPLTFHRTAEALTLERTQEPKPPFPYESHEVSFRNPEAAIDLAGTLVIPEGEGPFPAVLFVSGSGPQDRDEFLMGHRPFLVLADHLARRGIASLRYDDRGAGESQGDHMGSTVADFARDVEAGLAFLAARPEVDRAAVGILGHSEGGLSGARAAVASDEVDFLVALAPPGEPLRALLRRQAEAVFRQRGFDASLVEAILAAQQEELALVADAEIDAEELRTRLRALADERRGTFGEDQLAALGYDEATIAQGIEQAATPWFRSLVREDPAVYYRQLEIPVLALFGGKDLQVDAEVNAEAIRAALAAAGNEASEVRVLPGLNHLFQRSETGAIEEYGTIVETLSPEVLDLVADWVVERSGGG